MLYVRSSTAGWRCLPYSLVPAFCIAACAWRTHHTVIARQHHTAWMATGVERQVSAAIASAVGRVQRTAFLKSRTNSRNLRNCGRTSNCAASKMEVRSVWSTVAEGDRPCGGRSASTQAPARACDRTIVSCCSGATVMGRRTAIRTAISFHYPSRTPGVGT